MVPIAQDRLDPQFRADRTDFLEGLGIQRVHHGHREDAAELVDGQQVASEAQLLRHHLQEVPLDVVVEQADVGNFALLDEEGLERLLVDETQIDHGLADEGLVLVAARQGLAHLGRRAVSLVAKHLAQALGLIGRSPSFRGGGGRRRRSRTAPSRRLRRGCAGGSGFAVLSFVFAPTQHRCRSEVPAARGSFPWIPPARIVSPNRRSVNG